MAKSVDIEFTATVWSFENLKNSVDVSMSFL